MSRWTVHANRTLAEEVPAAPAEVRDFYLDLDNLTLVHPLVVSVRTTSRIENDDGYEQDYRIGDRISLGPLRFPISYRAKLSVPVEGHVTTAAHQFPHVRLDGTVSFEAVDSGTRIVEQLRIAAPRPLAAVTARQAVAAHRAMLAGIRRHFESRR